MNVDLTTVHQTIDGFGVTHYQPIAYASSFGSVADFLWRPDIGIGLSIYNTAIVADGSGNGWPMYFDPSWNGNDVIGDFSQELAAYQRGVRKFSARCWSAQMDPGPYTWQTGGSATGSLISSDYAAFTSMYTSFLTTAWQTYGIPWTHVSQMNEPDFTPSGYGQISWTTTQALNLLKNNLASALTSWASSNPSWVSATGLARPQVIWAETSNWANLSTWVAAVEGDSTALPEVGVYATHQYFGQGASSPPNPCSHPIWMTECYDQAVSSWDPSMTTALNVASYIHNALTTGNASAWLHWQSDQQIATDNQALLGTTATPVANNRSLYDNPTFPKRAYVLGHWSKLVRPGWHRVDVTSMPTGILATAFASPDSTQLAIVMVNNTGSPIAVSPTLTGGGVNYTLQTWTTDATRSLLASSVTSTTGALSSISVPANGLVTVNQTFARGLGPE